jgi:hypothetical protein
MVSRHVVVVIEAGRDGKGERVRQASTVRLPRPSVPLIASSRRRLPRLASSRRCRVANRRPAIVESSSCVASSSSMSRRVLPRWR